MSSLDKTRIFQLSAAQIFLSSLQMQFTINLSSTLNVLVPYYTIQPRVLYVIMRQSQLYNDIKVYIKPMLFFILNEVGNG